MTDQSKPDKMSETRALVKRLRNFADGCRGSMWQSRDETITLMDAGAAAQAHADAAHCGDVE